MPQPIRQSPYKTALDILERHGLIVFILYWVSALLSLASVGYWLRWLPRRVASLSSAYDATSDRIKPWWQDIVFLLLLILLTPLAVDIASSPRQQIAQFGSFLSVYLVFDTVIFQICVLWFDDLRPGISDSNRGVSSHRRILFVAILSFSQSILLFPAIYRWVPELSGYSYPSLLERSFSTATLLSLSLPISAFDVVQVILSLFFLAIVIATMVSIAYRRHEFSEEASNS